MHVRLQPLSSSSSAGRVGARQFLIDVARMDLTPDILVVVSELIAKAVMHARTEMTLSVELDDHGVQVVVTDGSPVLPHWSPRSPTSMSGRGLPLVVRLSREWGVEPLPDGDKRVWATVDAMSVLDDLSCPEDLMERWSDQPWPAEPVAEGGIDIDLDVDVQAMLDSRADTEDLVRGLQLLVLSAGDAVDAGNATSDDTTLVGLARQLDTANEQFHDARRQMFDQTVSAARRHQTQATLHLRLQHTDAEYAQRWLAASTRPTGSPPRARSCYRSSQRRWPRSAASTSGPSSPVSPSCRSSSATRGTGVEVAPKRSSPNRSSRASDSAVRRR